MLQHEVDALTRHQLAGGDVVLAGGVGAAQQRHRGLGGGHGDPRGGDVLGLGPDLQHRLGDDAERAFGADMEVAQIVAGIVLLERAQAVPYLALRRDHLDAQHKLAGVAVMQDLHAAGIGREVAADGAASFGGQRQRTQAVVLGGGLLDRLQHDAGLDRHRVAQRVDVEDAVHAVERQHDLAALLMRRAAAHHAGVAALGHHRDLLGEAELPDGGHLLGGGRAHHGQRGTEIVLAPVGEVGMLALIVGDQSTLADDGAQLVDEVGHLNSRFPSEPRVSGSCRGS